MKSHIPENPSWPVPLALGNQLQPHRAGWRERRTRTAPFVFLGLSGLAPVIRMQGLRAGGDGEMAWRAVAVDFRDAGRTWGRAGLPGPPGPPGPASQQEPASRPSGPASPGPARPGQAPSGKIAAAPVRERARPHPAAMGMFVFQQPAGIWGNASLPGPVPGMAGILAGRSGRSAMGAALPPRIPAGQPPRRDAAGGPMPFPAPDSAGRAAGMPGLPDAMGMRPPGPPPAPEQAPAPRIENRRFSIPAGTGGSLGAHDPHGGTGDALRRLPDERPSTPGRRGRPPGGLGMLSGIMSLLPGMVRREEDDDDASPRAGKPAGGKDPLPADAASGRPAPPPGPGGEESRDAALPMRIGGWTAAGDIFPPPPAGAGFPRPPRPKDRPREGSDLPQPVARGFGPPLDLMASAIDQVVARHVDRAMKAHRQTPAPRRPEPEPGPKPPGMENDRMARRLAERIRRLAQDERFRRGGLR